MGSSFLPASTKLQPLQTYLVPPTNKMKTLLVIAVAVVAAVVVEAAPAPGHHGHRNKHPEEHVCTEVDIQEIFEDGELIDIIEKIIPVACPEHGGHHPSPSHHRPRCDDDERWDSHKEKCVDRCSSSEEWDSDEEECVDDD